MAVSQHEIGNHTISGYGIPFHDRGLSDQQHGKAIRKFLVPARQQSKTQQTN